MEVRRRGSGGEMRAAGPSLPGVSLSPGRAAAWQHLACPPKGSQGTISPPGVETGARQTRCGARRRGARTHTHPAGLAPGTTGALCSPHTERGRQASHPTSFHPHMGGHTQGLHVGVCGSGRSRRTRAARHAEERAEGRGGHTGAGAPGLFFFLFFPPPSHLRADATAPTSTPDGQSRIWSIFRAWAWVGSGARQGYLKLANTQNSPFGVGRVRWGRPAPAWTSTCSVSLPLLSPLSLSSKHGTPPGSSLSQLACLYPLCVACVFHIERASSLYWG